MRFAFAFCLAVACSLAGAQAFANSVFAERKTDFISVPTITSDAVVIDIHSRSRTALLQLLHRLHGTDQWEYVVSFGLANRVTVWVPVQDLVTSGDPERTTILAYRSLLRSIDMTYRIEAGLFLPMYRYEGKFEPVEVVGSHGSMDIKADGSNSLDVLAAALALQGIGYRVVRASGSEVTVKASNCPLSIIVTVLQRIDDGIVIDQTLGYVVRRRDSDR